MRMRLPSYLLLARAAVRIMASPIRAREANAAPADYGNHGKYGDYGPFNDIQAAGTGNPYGS